MKFDSLKDVMSPPIPLVFMSDIHADRLPSPKNAQFIRALDFWRGRCSRLILLGDIWDAWLGDDSLDCAEWSGYHMVMEALARTANQVNLEVMVGNRDFLLGEQALTLMGAKALPDPSVLILPNGVRALITHGDQLCLSDTAHIASINTIRTPQCVRAFLAKQMAERVAMLSAYHGADQWVDIDEEEAGRWLAQNDCTTLIHGHTHQPAHHPKTATRTWERFVLHNWDSVPGALVWQENCLKLARFSGPSEPLRLILE